MPDDKDDITGEWLYIYNELITQEDKKRGYYEMIGGKEFSGYNSYVGNQGGTYMIPLNFWFTQEIGSAIPYVALQYSDIEIKLKDETQGYADDKNIKEYHILKYHGTIDSEDMFSKSEN